MVTTILIRLAELAARVEGWAMWPLGDRRRGTQEFPEEETCAPTWVLSLALRLTVAVQRWILDYLLWRGIARRVGHMVYIEYGVPARSSISLVQKNAPEV